MWFWNACLVCKFPVDTDLTMVWATLRFDFHKSLTVPNAKLSPFAIYWKEVKSGLPAKSGACMTSACLMAAPFSTKTARLPNLI